MRLPIRFRILVSIGLLAALGFLRAAPPAWSFAVTKGAIERLTVYRGVMTTVTASNAILEFGNHGREIAATGDIFFRPSGSTEGSKFSKHPTDTTQDLTITGNLTLYGSLCFNGDCKSAWPAGGGGSWGAYTNPFGTNFLRPVNTNAGVTIGTAASPITSGTALTVTSATAGTFVNRGSGLAAQFQSNSTSTINGDLYVYGDILSAGMTPYDSLNDGTDSGVDADKFDSATVRLENAEHCYSGSGDVTTLACLCFRSDTCSQHPEILCWNNSDCPNVGGGEICVQNGGIQGFEINDCARLTNY